LSILAPPKPVLHVPEKLHLMLERELSILTRMLLSARKFLLLYVFFLLDNFLFCFLSCLFICCSGDEEENAPIDATARTSTSRPLVVSEAQPDGDETSPPQQNTEHPTPVESPRASSPKRARLEPAKEPILFSGGSTTPSLDDVSFSLFFFYVLSLSVLSALLCFLRGVVELLLAILTSLFL
jgi:hypothetical protein